MCFLVTESDSVHSENEEEEALRCSTNNGVNGDHHSKTSDTGEIFKTDQSQQTTPTTPTTPEGKSYKSRIRSSRVNTIANKVSYC